MRCFLIRNAAGEQVGIGLERANGEIVARLPVDLDGARIGGDHSRWEDLEMATWVIDALGMRIEWLKPQLSHLSGEWRSLLEATDPEPPLPTGRVDRGAAWVPDTAFLVVDEE